MKKKIGRTGLSQKDAVFDIIKSILGASYDPKTGVEGLIAKKADGYIRPRWNSELLERMIALVAQGLQDGTVPSKYNSSSYELQIRQYANRITHYWITHDTRLNGNTSGTREPKLKARNYAIKHNLANDLLLKKLRYSQAQVATLEDGLHAHLWILGRSFEVVLEAYGINPSELPEDVQKHLYFNGELSPWKETKKKAA